MICICAAGLDRLRILNTMVRPEGFTSFGTLAISLLSTPRVGSLSIPVDETTAGTPKPREANATVPPFVTQHVRTLQFYIPLEYR